jgi:esterase/lipase
MIKDLVKLLSIGLILFAAGFLLKSAGVAELSAAPDKDNSNIKFVTDDSLTLHAWISPAKVDSAGPDAVSGLVLLLPMMSHTHESYDPIIEKLNKVNYTTIAFDLRGHGRSIKLRDDTIRADMMDKGQFAKMPSDINQFFKDFRAKNPHKYNYEDVVVIGASIGANTAGLLIQKNWIKRVVMLSPGRDYYGLQPETAMIVEEVTSEVPVYIAVSVDDSYSAESSQWLFDNYTGPKVLKKYPGGLHGTDMLNEIPDADTELISWLRPKK